MLLNKVAIVLVNYRQSLHTIDCLHSIRRLNYNDWSAIIVDNNSQDGSYERFLEEGNDVVVIESGENNGFASGCNIGIRYALEHGVEYVLLLNNDTVVDPNLLDRLLEFSDDTTVTVPKMYYYNNPNILWYAGGYIDMLRGTAFHYGENESDEGQFDKVREISFATGCCMLIPKNVLVTVPLMDEAYFLYFEDVDYSFSLNRHGIKILYCPEAKLWHKVSSSTGKNSKLVEYYTNRNRLYCIEKYKCSIVARLYTYVTRAIKYIHGKLTNGNEVVVLQSYLDYRNGRMGKQNLRQ